MIDSTISDDNWATMDPCAMIDSEDNIHLVWKDARTGTREVYYKKCTAAGVWDAEPTNISNTATASARPIISINDSDDLFLVWEEEVDGIHFDIVYKIFENASSTWSTMQNLSNSWSIDSILPSIPINTNNYLYIIWTEGDNSPYNIMFNRVQLVGIEDEYIGSVGTSMMNDVRGNPFVPTNYRRSNQSQDWNYGRNYE